MSIRTLIDTLADDIKYQLLTKDVPLSCPEFVLELLSSVAAALFRDKLQADIATPWEERLEENFTLRPNLVMSYDGDASVTLSPGEPKSPITLLVYDVVYDDISQHPDASWADLVIAKIISPKRTVTVVTPISEVINLYKKFPDASILLPKKTVVVRYKGGVPEKLKAPAMEGRILNQKLGRLSPPST